jgi:hypothetical protein
MPLLTLTSRWGSFLELKLLPLTLFYDMSSQAEIEVSSTDQLPNDNTIHALVIGINKYSSLMYPELAAGVADADAIQDFLLNRLKASPNNIISLRDAEATRQRILCAFEQLEKNTAATVDPCIIIYFSGHGTQGPGPKGWEAWGAESQWFEQLCPSDCEAVVDGRVVEGIPDYLVCGLLNSLAQKRGNKIVSFISLCS